ncbi:hypothetical protein P7C71_g2926, partial [Lecanoromycetidae sp. Uapishka_2]
MVLNSSAIYPSSDPEFISFPSRRSVVHSTNGIVACTQPLAAAAGQRILRAGGSAADAAVAVAAALNMTEPSSTGIGGDMFCLFYNAETKKVEAMNGSGRSSESGSLQEIRKDLGLRTGEPGGIPMTSVHAVTTPGAAAGWVDTIEKFGSGILEELEKTSKIRTFTEKDHNCVEYLHAVIEALRIAFADAAWFVTDPNVIKVPTEEMISRPYLAERAKLFNPKKASSRLAHGSPAHNHSDTVYFATTDRHGNGCSFINSNYGGFGTCIIPKGCGFTLQNRGANFSLDEGHPNVFAPRKRPYHTIIPAMITNSDDGSLHSVYGVMGGFMQPQGHVQVLLNMLTFKYNPQAALDAPRICIGAGMPGAGDLFGTVYLEDGISQDVANQLTIMGHDVEIVSGYQRGLFGRGQVIRCHMEDGRHIYSAGSDPRGDGGAFPV